MAATFLRMGALAVVVGCTPAPPVAAANAPDLVIAPLGDAGTSEAHPGVRFGHAPASEGDAFHVLRHTKRRNAREDSDDTSAYRVEIQEVVAGAPSRMVVHFDTSTREPPPPLHGHTYVVSSHSPQVRDLDGAPVHAADANRVLDILPPLGTRDRIDQAIPDDPVPIGAHVDALASAIWSVLHPRAWKLETGAAVLREATPEEGVFDVSITAITTTAIYMRMDVQGEARVRRSDSRLVEVALRGAYATREDENGTIEVTRTITSDPGSRSGR